MLRLLLDTNIHSDWANDPPSLDGAIIRRLSRVVADPRVETILHSSSLMEFRWPSDKQERWIVRVFRQASQVSMLMGDPV